jgi:[acyl-carrier-protein] S-malonyltransferase
MGRDLAAAFPEAKAVFDEADDALGFSLSGACFDGDAEALRATHTAQPALLVHGAAAWRVTRDAAARSRGGRSLAW